ncbi:hypothetical protein Pmani_005789 [Petrolisthes manimaculis]|uniref:Chitin-binding type-2 domain-containing protein n=1 Tax=Petrolisthes manimaculis TaxID=1843537 RepID=A0AAE1UMJ5_9EUCA|nr:hypothetical protein Pmani_005789 [Petrolisthes manimaculis]
MAVYSLVVLLILGVVGRSQAQNGNGQNGNGYSYNTPLTNGYSGGPQLRTDQSLLNPVEALMRNIPGGGVPEEDYPILASVPNTGFTCRDQEYPGYFADTADEAGCQVFHICQFDGRQDSFLCPNGTLFSQQYFVCDWWFNVDCQASEQFRSLNTNIGKVMEDQAASFRSNDIYSPPTQTLSRTSYNPPQERQSIPTPSSPPRYTPPQNRQAPTPAPTPAPVQTYTAPQERQTPVPINTYSVPEDRQVPIPSPSQFYSSPNRF